MIQPLLGMIYTECDQIAAGSSGEDSDIADPDYELDAIYEGDETDEGGSDGSEEDSHGGGS